MPHPLDRLRSALADRHVVERELGAGGMADARLARYCARNPVALERLQYDGPAAPVRLASALHLAVPPRTCGTISSDRA